MKKKYERINWQNEPSTATELDADNLNRMDKGIDDLDNSVVSFDYSISNIENELSLTNVNNYGVEIGTLGTSASTRGAETASTKRVRSGYIPVGVGDKIEAKGIYSFTVHAYDNNKTIPCLWNISYTKEYTSDFVGYVRLVSKKADESAISIDEANDIMSSISVTKNNSVINKADFAFEYVDKNKHTIIRYGYSAGTLGTSDDNRGAEVDSVKRFRSNYIPVKNGDVIISSDYPFTVHAYDNNKTIPCLWNITYTNKYVSDFDGYVRLVARKEDDSTMSKDDLYAIANSISFCDSNGTDGSIEKINGSPIKVRFVSFNVGQYSNGSTDDSVLPTNFEGYIKYIQRLSADVLGTQEEREIYDVMTEETVWEKFYKHIYKHGGVVSKSTSSQSKRFGKAVYSNYQLTNPEKYTFKTQGKTSSGGTQWSSFTSYICTIVKYNVLVISAHLAAFGDLENENIRKKQITEILDYVKSKKVEYCVIMGDMNVSGNEISLFIDAGYTCANQGMYGAYVTHGSSDFFDNIIVSPNIKMTGINVDYDNDFGDHYAIIADLTFV